MNHPAHQVDSSSQLWWVPMDSDSSYTFWKEEKKTMKSRLSGFQQSVTSTALTGAVCVVCFSIIMKASWLALCSLGSGRQRATAGVTKGSPLKCGGRLRLTIRHFYNPSSAFPITKMKLPLLWNMTAGFFAAWWYYYCTTVSDNKWVGDVSIWSCWAILQFKILPLHFQPHLPLSLHPPLLWCPQMTPIWQTASWDFHFSIGCYLSCNFMLPTLSLSIGLSVHLSHT